MSDIETINIGEMNESFEEKPSVNFGSGIELLMNDRKKRESGANTPTSDINLGDLQSLEQELNELTDNEDKAPSMREARSSLFSSIPTSSDMNVSFSDKKDNDIDNLSIASLRPDTDLNINTEPIAPSFKVKKEPLMKKHGMVMENSMIFLLIQRKICLVFQQCQKKNYYAKSLNILKN